MGGKASLILVLGFAVIFGYVNFNITKITTKSVENMVGYNQVAVSRNIASAGAHAGLAQLMYKPYPHNNRVLSAKSFTDGSYKGCSYTVRIDSVANPRPHLVMTSVSKCTTFLYEDAARTVPYVIEDKVVVRLDYDRRAYFSSFGWMSNQEGNVFFTSGDTLWGKVHSNDNIHIDKKPVFHGKVTTSKLFNPKKNSGVFLGNKEQGAAEVAFPTDLSELKINATNSLASRSLEIYVEMKPGSSANNDGYAIISIGGFVGSGGTKIDSLALSDASDNVIYTTQNLHIKGELDGRLSIASEQDIRLERSVTYERYPDAYTKDPGLDAEPPTLLLPQNDTQDMLGLVAKNDVRIAAGNGDITIHGAVFAKDGSFRAEEWNVNHYVGRINLIGSICQDTRGPVGQTNGNGYKKSYRFDPRFSEEFSHNIGMHPPSFPSYPVAGELSITNWWEKPSQPLIVQKYY